MPGSGSQRIYGAGPTSVADAMVEQTYKYDSGSKEFKELPTMVRDQASHSASRARLPAGLLAGLLRVLLASRKDSAGTRAVRLPC